MIQMLTPLIYVFAFLAAVVFIQTVASLIFDRGDRKQRVNRRLTMLDAGISHERVYAELVRQTSNPIVGGGKLASLQSGFATYVAQAGLSLTPTQILIMTAGGAGLLWLLSLSFAHASSSLGFLLNGAISLVGAIALSTLGVWLWIRRARNIRIKQLETQLPVALDIVNRAVRAGHPVVSAVHLASEEMSDPIGSEFGLIVDETSYGVEFKEALVNFARRTGSSDGHFFAVCVSVQSETGGNLAEILEGLSSVIRGRHTLTMRVKALASEGRASALLLSVLPAFVIGVQLLFHPRLYADKFSDPIFWPVVSITAIMYFVGWLIVNRIINFRY